MAGRPTAALVLSPGAPMVQLMAGALTALYERGKTFDIISASGAGVVAGLLFVAPQGQKSPAQALRDTVNMGVSDSIYRLFPVGYKTFFKSGPFTRPMHRWGQMCKSWADMWLRPAERWLGTSTDESKRLVHDWIDLWIAALTPTTLRAASQGVCAPFPFLDELVDFEKLRQFPGEFSINAYNVTDGKMERFEKTEITPAHVHAALAFPFVYPPITVQGKHYYEGGDFDPIDDFALTEADIRRKLVQQRARLQANNGPMTVVLIDVLGEEGLHTSFIREPRNLWDAYGMSILMSVVALTKRDVEQFRKMAGEAEYNLLQMKWPPSLLEAPITDWSYSNVVRLWEHGYAAGEDFYRRHKDLLPDRRDETAFPPS